ncbi:MAG TPA: hypothetical protein PK529_13330, partial [Verrucomicrobiales bacterium]|nr:hypothetical protein [Verrucomicrobiales bacterium]
DDLLAWVDLRGACLANLASFPSDALLLSDIERSEPDEWQPRTPAFTAEEGALRGIPVELVDLKRN